MKTSKIQLLFIISFLLVASCNKQNEQPNPSTNNYILFGHFYGFCAGEQCVEIFKLHEEELYEDTNDIYPSSETFYEGKFVELNREKYDLVKALLDKVPSELMLESKHVIGSPDAADGGGVYFAIFDDKETKFWLIDQFDHNIPEYLRPFKNEINNAFAMINQ